MGKSEHEILSTLQELWMAFQAYKTQGVTNAHAVVALVVGFTG